LSPAGTSIEECPSNVMVALSVAQHRSPVFFD
jgi:hypothetical protein